MPKQLNADHVLRAQGQVVARRPSEKERKLAGGGFPSGNKAAVKHGAYATVFVTREERDQFLALRQEIAREFKKETGPDTAMLDAAALLFMRHGRAVIAGEQDLANKTMASILAMLDRLKATRASREGDRPAYETTPAEWASELLAGSRERSAKPGTPDINAAQPNETEDIAPASYAECSSSDRFV
jgi:hypothetical protein